MIAPLEIVSKTNTFELYGVPAVCADAEINEDVADDQLLPLTTRVTSNDVPLLLK
jgi:hypothetical protein